MTPDFAFENTPKVDLVVVPGGNTSAVGTSGREWLKKANGEAEIIMSVCYGEFLLAERGRGQGAGTGDVDVNRAAVCC